MTKNTMDRLTAWCRSIATARLNRREFLKKEIKGVLWMGAGAGIIPRFTTTVHASALPDLAVIKGAPGPAVRAAIDTLGGIKAFVKPGDKVVIKPNMSFADPPELATTTHPLVIRELAALCTEAGAAWVRVLDHTLRKEELCIEGVRNACNIIDKNMVFGLSNPTLYQETRIPGAKAMKKTDVVRDALAADVLIAAPVAKSHGSAGVSLSMKGMMGLIYDRRIMHWQYDLATSIVDLASLLKPDLVVVDATRVLSTNGPSGPGKVLRENTVIAARDMVAADAQAVTLFEWYGRRMHPRQVKHILLAHKRGLGRMDVENLTVVQNSV